MAPNPDLEYHALAFQRRNEAAAFVAALSRVLASPAYPVSTGAAPEVWLGTVGAESVTLYLNQAALVAARTTFDPVPVGGSVRGSLLAPTCHRLIGGGVGAAWGVNEAERAMFGGDGAA